MAKTQFKIDGTLIKRPHNFKMETYPVSNLQRKANGDMAGDFIARKRKFFFTYEAITTTELQVIERLIVNTNSMFHTLSWVEDNVTKTCTIYYGSFPKELVRTGAEWVWKGVSFNLIEQ